MQKAIEDGRIAAAVARDASGKFVGIDPIRADRLWAEQTALVTMNGTNGLPGALAAVKPAPTGRQKAAKPDPAPKPAKQAAKPAPAKPATPAPAAKPAAEAAPPPPAAEPRRKKTPPARPTADDDGIEFGEQSAGETYAQARARNESYKAELARLDYEQKCGTLISADKVKAACFKAAATVKESLINIPSRISPELASVTDPFEIERILKQEIYGVLELCHREFAKAGGGAG